MNSIKRSSVESAIAAALVFGLALYLVQTDNRGTACELANNTDVVMTLARGNCGHASVWVSH